MTTLRFTQITDLHLGPARDSTLAGVRTAESFESVLQAVERKGRGSDMLLLTGDLAADCDPEAYQILNQILIDEGKRAIWLPGNHDNFDLMVTNLVDYPPIQVKVAGNWAVLTLDSSQPKKPGGHISEAQLEQIAQNLKSHADKFVLLAMHHSPVAVGCDWLDQQMIDNEHRLYALLHVHGNVKGVITGHVHQPFAGYWGEIAVYSTPSSCVQFKQNCKNFTLSSDSPGDRKSVV